MLDINWAFWGNTVPEIMENLKQVGTPFTLECLENMKKNSPISMALALKLVRAGKL